MRPFLIWAYALMLAACSPVAGQNSMVGSSPPDTLPFERLDSRELRIPDAGWALIRNQERWKKLWRDYGREAYRNGELAVPDAPDVDFDRNEVLAVSFGPKSDCSSKVVIVEHVLEYARERVAIITPDHFAQGGPCQMIVEPIDLVVIPRSDKVMRLELVTRMKESHWKVPAQASWWVPLRAHAARDSGTTWATRRAYILSRRVLPRDTTLPLRDYRVLAAEAYASRDGYIKGKLRRNRRAMADRDVVAWLAVDPQDDVAELRYDFLRRFGLQVASDDWVPRVWLAMLIELLMSPGTKWADGTAPYRDVALALTHNAAVLSDTLLAMRLTFGTQYYPDVQAIACRRYLERYPRVLVDQSDSRGGGLVPNCPN